MQTRLHAALDFSQALSAWLGKGGWATTLRSIKKGIGPISEPALAAWAFLVWSFRNTVEPKRSLRPDKSQLFMNWRHS